MTDTEADLLENVLDSLDRLFDRESSAIDVYVLLFATQKALSGSGCCPDLSGYVDSLAAIVRSGESVDSQRENALAVTDNLRSVLNKLLPTP